MKLFPKLHPKPKAVSELKFTLEKTRENFLQKKAVPSIRKRLREWAKADGRHLEYFL